MSIVNTLRREALRLRLSMQEAMQPLPSRGQVEQVVREMEQQQKQPQTSMNTYELPDERHRPYYRSSSGQQRQPSQDQVQAQQPPQSRGLISGLLSGLGGGAGGRFPIRDALATYIKSRVAPQEPQEGTRGERKQWISLAD